MIHYIDHINSGDVCLNKFDFILADIVSLSIGIKVVLNFVPI